VARRTSDKSYNTISEERAQSRYRKLASQTGPRPRFG